MALSNEISLELVEDFFRLNSTCKPIEVAATLTDGLGIDNRSAFFQTPPSKTNQGGIEYAKPYRQKEESELLHEASYKSTTLETEGGDTLISLSHLTEVEERSTVALEIANVNELKDEEAVQVYSTYYPTLQLQGSYNADLAITRYKEKIIKFVNNYSVVIIQGPTGCGKTTQVPQYIIDYHAAHGKYCNIIVTQPRKIAAISIAKRVCQERGWLLGTIVGYQVAMDSNVCEDTRLSYVTTGVLLQKLIANRRMDMYTHVIIDEVHERDQDTDFALLVVKKLLNTNSRGVKVLLMSATMDTVEFSRYFSKASCGRLDSAPVIEVLGKSKYVAEYYIEEIRSLGPIPPFDPENPCIPDELYSLAHNLIKFFDNIEKKEQNNPDSISELNRGSVLIFLPGYNEISKMKEVLREDETMRRWWILPLHSTITGEEQALVFQNVPKGSRKIILSTNIAESSITVPDIKYVIDFCLTKNLVCDPETNYSSLQPEWASKTNCTQRKGRAGRVCEGRVYRMVPQKFYTECLPEYGIPEIKRCPLEQTVLSAKMLNYGEPKALLALAIEPPNLADIGRAILVLKEVGALAITVTSSDSVQHVTPYDGDLTFIGRIMALLPLDVKISKLIILGYVFNYLEEALIIAASLSLKNFFAKPFQKFLEAYKSRLSWADGSFSDCFAFLNAYRMWQEHKQQGTFKRPNMDETEWGRRNFIQIKRIKEVELLVKDLKKRLNKVNIRSKQALSSRPPQDMLILKIVIAGAFYPNYFVMEETDEREISREIGGKDHLTTVMLSGFPSNQGLLYAHSVKEMLKCCSSNIQISFEEGKAFVQFGRSAEGDDTGIASAVYVAVKMRQLRMPLKLRLYHPDEAKRKLDQLRNLRYKMCADNKVLRTNRMRFHLYQHHLNPVELPKIKTLTIRLFVTSIVDCGHFWAQYFEPRAQENINLIREDIRRYLYLHGNLQNGKLERGMLVLAPYSDTPNALEYYRARVEDIGNDGVKVFFVDYGNSEHIIDTSKIHHIDPEQATDLLTIPQQAFECALCEIRPSLIRSPRGCWTSNAKQWFQKMVSGHELFARVYSVVDQVIRLELIKYDRNGTQISINQKLIEMGEGEFIEESYVSKQNHELRMRHEEAATKLCDDDRYVNDVLEISMNEAKDFMTLPQSSSKVNLRGPYSPLEIRFLGITRLGNSRSVKIDQDSVNSVALDQEPQDKHERMLVACHVGLNATSNSLSLHNTTLMPNIHGLSSLIPLLFCPSAEFRTDPERNRYTGAICGLGCNPETGESLYPENDIEVVFDTGFTYDDIIKINSVRMGINLALNSEDCVSDWDARGLSNVQELINEKLLKLLGRKRKPQSARSFQKKYLWKQVRKEHLLEHQLEDDSGADCPHVLPLHKAIYLTEDPVRLSLIKNMEELKTRAGRSKNSEVNKCKLCNVTTFTPRDLTLHLDTSDHKMKEKLLLED